MSEIEKDVYRVPGIAHSTVTMAVLVAQKFYSSRSTNITPAEFEIAMDAVCVGDNWNTPPVDVRTFALMVMAALQFGVWIESTATAEHF